MSLPVSSVGRLSGISSRNCINIEVGREILEHWTRFASLKIVDKLRVLIVSVHSLESGEEIIGIEVSARKSNETWSTVVEETQENVVISTRQKGSSVSSFNGGLVVGEDSKIVSWGNSGTFVIDDAASIDINTRVFSRRFVEKLSLVWVLLAVGNIIVREYDDVRSEVSLLEKGLVSMADIRLMSVIAVSIRTSNEHCVVFSESTSKQCNEGNKNKFIHFSYLILYLFLIFLCRYYYLYFLLNPCHTCIWQVSKLKMNPWFRRISLLKINSFIIYPRINVSCCHFGFICYLWYMKSC